MDRKTLMQDIAGRAFRARLSLHKVCREAGVSATVAFRWRTSGTAPLLATIGKLERALDKLEAQS